MKERPILFSTPMVQAILEGRKTQTRRVVKGEIKEWLETSTNPDWFKTVPIHCPYGQPGDFLWVRESWNWIDEEETRVEFKAQYTYPEYHKWKQSIHMPKVAARIWLKVQDVRVERLQDISEEDAMAEGCVCKERKSDFYTDEFEFKSLWEKINGEASWQANPWVWVIEFEKINHSPIH